MKLYLVIEPAGYVDPEEVRGVFSTHELAFAAARSNDRIDEIELDRVYPHGTNMEWVTFKSAPRQPLTPMQEAIIKDIAAKSPWEGLTK